MTQLRNNDIQFRKLFDVKTQEQIQSFIALSGDGELLYVTEQLGGTVFLHCERTVFRINKSEFLEYLAKAKRNKKLLKAIERGYTTLEEVERLSR